MQHTKTTITIMQHSHRAGNGKTSTWPSCYQLHFTLITSYSPEINSEQKSSDFGEFSRHLARELCLLLLYTTDSKRKHIPNSSSNQLEREAASLMLPRKWDPLHSAIVKHFEAPSSQQPPGPLQTAS